MPQPSPLLILASQSKPRKLLLEQLKIPFLTIPANINETPKKNENKNPENLVERLSKEKGLAIVNLLKNQKLTPEIKPDLNPDYIIISSDQVAVFNNKIYGKPGDFSQAKKQLLIFNNNTIDFITGLCLIKFSNNTPLQIRYTHEISSIKLKKLTENQIENYLHKEKPYQCAASFKLEGLGITLIEAIQTKDFNAIIGLPMIALIKSLEEMGLDLLGS